MKKVIKCICFILILGLVIHGLSSLLMPKWIDCENRETSVVKEFYNMKKNSAEVCVLGSSQIVSGISCMEMYEQDGVSAVSLGTGNQSILLSYYWLKEVQKKNDLKLVILDTSMLFEENSEFQSKKALDNMHFSWNKLQAVIAQSKVEGADTVGSYLCKLYRYHTRWDELSEEDFTRFTDDRHSYRGNTFLISESAVDYDKIVMDNDQIDDSVKPVGFEMQYLNKFIDYCKQNNIELLLIKTPKQDWNLSKNRIVQQIADESGLAFLDFNRRDLFEKTNLLCQEDFHNPSHLNARGAVKLSQYLSKYITANYSLTNYKDQGLVSNEELVAFDNEKKDFMLATETDIQTYLQSLGDGRYEVLLSISGNLGEAWTSDYQDLLAQYGIASDMAKLNQSSFVAHIVAGQCIYANAGDSDIEYAAAFGDGVPFYSYSSTNRSKALQYTINGQSKKQKASGLNIRVYNNQNHELIDVVTLMIDEKSELQMKREIGVRR